MQNSMSFFEVSASWTDFASALGKTIGPTSPDTVKPVVFVKVHLITQPRSSADAVCVSFDCPFSPVER